LQRPFEKLHGKGGLAGHVQDFGYVYVLYKGSEPCVCAVQCCTMYTAGVTWRTLIGESRLPEVARVRHTSNNCLIKRS
jgi:hypothetical protein